MALRVEKMTSDHLDAVFELEKKCFSTPWSRESFIQETETNALAHYVVGFEGEDLVAYGGFWLVVDEAHITNIAVSPDTRRKGYGKVLVEAMLQEAKCLGALRSTLEVRESNVAARALYGGFGFKDIGLRKNYYESPKEDAVIMWMDL